MDILVDKIFHMLFCGNIPEFIFNTDPELYEYYSVEYQNIDLMLYVQLNNVLCSTLYSVFPFYKKYEYLECNEFKLNHYNHCIASNMVNDQHITICWYVDDLNISHMKFFYNKYNYMVPVHLWVDT